MIDRNIRAMLMAQGCKLNRHMMVLFLCSARLSLRQMARVGFGAVGSTALVSRG